MRNKRGERERRAVREGECTGGQWDRASSALVVICEGGHWHRLIVTIRGGGHWCRLLVVICFCSPLISFVTVHRAPLLVVRSYPSHIVKLFCMGGLLHLVLGEVEGAGGQMILGSRHWWCSISCVRASSRGPWWSCVVFMGAGCRLGLLSASCVLLGGCGHLLDSCCCSWTAGIVSVGGLHVMLHWGDVVVKQTWVVVGWCVEVVGGIAGVVVVD